MPSLVRTPIDPPQSFADTHTLVAQRYAGFFLGHPFRAAQQRIGPEAIQIDWNTPWREPAVVSDDCVFCGRLSDDEAVRRVAGYQHAIDIEVLRPQALAYAEWLGSDAAITEEVNIGGYVTRRGVSANPQNRRRFIEQHAGRFKERPISMIDLPLRLKRKLCIEWNHLYRDWMIAEPDVQYDPEHRQFYREIELPAERAETEMKDWWRGYLPDNPITGGM